MTTPYRGSRKYYTLPTKKPKGKPKGKGRSYYSRDSGGSGDVRERVDPVTRARREERDRTPTEPALIKKKKKVVKTIPLLPKITRKRKVAKKTKPVKATTKSKGAFIDSRDIRDYYDEGRFKTTKRIGPRPNSNRNQFLNPKKSKR